MNSIRRRDSYQQVVSSIFSRCLVQNSDAGGGVSAGYNLTDGPKVPQSPLVTNLTEIKNYGSEHIADSSDKDDVGSWKWKIELHWITKALEPAMQLYKWASEAGFVLPSSCQHCLSFFNLLSWENMGKWIEQRTWHYFLFTPVYNLWAIILWSETFIVSLHSLLNHKVTTTTCLMIQKKISISKAFLIFNFFIFICFVVFIASNGRIKCAGTLLGTVVANYFIFMFQLFNSLSQPSLRMRLSCNSYVVLKK